MKVDYSTSNIAVSAGANPAAHSYTDEGYVFPMRYQSSPERRDE